MLAIHVYTANLDCSLFFPSLHTTLHTKKDEQKYEPFFHVLFSFVLFSFLPFSVILIDHDANPFHSLLLTATPHEKDEQKNWGSFYVLYSLAFHNNCRRQEGVKAARGHWGRDGTQSTRQGGVLRQATGDALRFRHIWNSVII